MTPRIRPYRPSDRGDVYDVCVRTAAAGGDATGVYSSDSLMPDIFAGPYLQFEPGLAFVVDTGDRVSGYVIGAGDTRAFVERFRTEWLPTFASKYPRVDPPVTAEDEIVHLGHTPERMLIPEVDEFPAHLHIDLLPQLQGLGLGRRLIDVLRAELASRGIPRLHLTMDPANTPARAFYDRIGFRQLPSGALGSETGAESGVEQATGS